MIEKAGRYQIIEEVGRGAMGVVYRGFDPTINRTVAIKTIYLDNADPALLTRLDEVRTQVTKPLAVGFGISKHEHYAALKERCDAIVVGSAIVRAVADGDADGAPERAGAVVRGIVGPVSA